jgi:hypothetical protein
MSTNDYELNSAIAAIAKDAIRSAEKCPGNWVNPLAGYFAGRVLCAQSGSQAEHCFADLAVVPPADIMEELIDRAQTSGIFVVFPSPTRSGSPSIAYDATQAVHLLIRTWKVEFEPGAPAEETRTQILRLAAPDKQARSIKQDRCFSTEDSGIPGFKRFYSADRRFPVSIAFPEDGSYFYDFNRAQNLDVEFYPNIGSKSIFVVSRLDLALLAEDYDQDARMVMTNQRDLAWFVERQSEMSKKTRGSPERYWIKTSDPDMAIVGSGEHRFKASRVVWRSPSGTTGERVFFAFASGELWGIGYEPSESFGEREFRIILGSFRLLRDGFFDSLSAGA